MAASPAPFSNEFAATARDELVRLGARAAEMRTRGDRWVARGMDLLREAERLEHRVRELQEFLGQAPQLRLDLQTHALQGQRLREAATRILLQRRGLAKPIHYRDWFALLIEDGLRVSGKDPLATFLTQITRSPIVVRVDARPGIYVLDPHGAYERARAELHKTVAVSGGGNPAPVERARRNLEAVASARSELLRDRINNR